MQNNFINYFEKTVELNPFKKAIIEKNSSINFINLKNRSIKVSLELQKFNKDSSNFLVAVYLDKSINLSISNIAVTYAGGFFVNIDPENPINKNLTILKKLSPKIIITDNKNFKLLKNKLNKKYKVLVYEKLIKKNFLKIKKKQNFYKNRIDADPYCIINTSGSTGTPKGVVLSHKNFFDFMEWTKDEFQFRKNLIIGSLSPSVFDIFNFEIFMMAFNSSTIVIIPKIYIPFPYEILKFIKQRKVNFIFWVPTIMVNIANQNLLDKINIKSIKTIWFAGEVFPTKQFNYWQKKLNKTQFVNLYGPIEITLDCIFYKIKKKIDLKHKIPIGVPCKNTDILIMNKNNKICKNYEEGEICVRGSSVALGYYNDHENTKKRFVQNPLNKMYQETIYKTGDFAYKDNNNQIIFLGRKDNQIKHLGYRIELSEIEHFILSFIKKVRNCCVNYNANQKKIIMFYESRFRLSDKYFYNILKKYVPKYMIPNKFLSEKKIKMNLNGKVDRQFYQNKTNKIV